MSKDVLRNLDRNFRWVCHAYSNKSIQEIAVRLNCGVSTEYLHIKTPGYVLNWLKGMCVGVSLVEWEE